MRNNADHVTAATIGTTITLGAAAGNALVGLIEIIIMWLIAPFYVKMILLRSFIVYPYIAYNYLKHIHFHTDNAIICTVICTILFFLAECVIAAWRFKNKEPDPLGKMFIFRVFLLYPLTTYLATHYGLPWLLFLLYKAKILYCGFYLNRMDCIIFSCAALIIGFNVEKFYLWLKKRKEPAPILFYGPIEIDGNE